MSALVFVDFRELGVDHVVVGLGGFRRSSGSLLLLVDGLTDLHRHLGQFLSLGVDFGRVVAFQSGLGRGDRGLDFSLERSVDLVGVLTQLLLRRVDEAVGLIAGLGRFAALLVLFGELLGVTDHLVDVAVRKAARGLDADLLFLAGALVLGGDVHEAVGVDVEGHLDLRDAATRRRDADEVELAEQLVVLRHLALALEHADRYRLLVVLGGRVDLALLSRDRRVAVDHLGHDTAQRLDAQRQRGHVEKQHVLDVALQHAGLDRRAHGDDFVRVHAGVRFLAEEVLHDFTHLGHAGHAAHEHDFVDVLGRKAGIGDGLAAGLQRALDQVGDHALQVGTGDRLDEVQRGGGAAFHARGDEGQVHFGRRGGRQFDLRLFSRFLQALQSQLVGLEVEAFLGLELVRQPFHDLRVEVFTAEEGITVGRLHLEHAVADFQNRDVEGAAAEVVDRDRLAVLLVEAIGQRRSGRLVDDAQHFETGDLAGVLGRLALGVVEIRGNGDDRLRDRLAQIRFGGFLHLLEREGADLRGRVILTASLNPGIAVLALDDVVWNQLGVLLGHRVVEAAADEALHREDRIVAVGHGLALCRLPDQALTILGESDDRGRGARAF
ncbi:putative NAD-specific glutamate dehydrogenase [Sphingomonas sp. LH128]|nr:putative NAD-specific glutamate dehydrogenase [Sphingomonas sp. LH128]